MTCVLGVYCCCFFINIYAVSSEERKHRRIEKLLQSDFSWKTVREREREWGGYTALAGSTSEFVHTNLALKTWAWWSVTITENSDEQREEELTLSSWCVLTRWKFSLWVLIFEFAFSISFQFSLFSLANRLHLLLGSGHTEKRMVRRRFALRVERLRCANFRYFRITILAVNQKLMVVVIRCADKQSFSTFSFSIMFMAHSGAVDLEMCDKVCKLTEAHSLSFSFSADHTVSVVSSVHSLLFPQLFCWTPSNGY